MHQIVSTLRTLFVWTLLLGLPAAAAAQDVLISLAPASGSAGTQVTIPVRVSDLTGQNVTSFQFDFTYDETILTIDGIVTEGTLSQDFGQNVMGARRPEGFYRVGGFGLAPLSGEGTLVLLKATLHRQGETMFRSWGQLNASQPPNEQFDPADVRIVVGQTATSTEADDVPRTYALAQNYPNPFNPRTTIEYALPEAAPVTIKVYSVLGKEVATLVSGVQPAGQHAVQFDAARLPSGIYLYRIQAGRYEATRQMVLLK